MQLIVDKILWGALILLFGPTVMTVASWNALPGDNLYGVKLALEKTALALASPSYATSGNLQIKYTERRFAEAKQLVASKQSIQGLPYLDQQIAQTKKVIENAPNKETQVELAKQYINTLSTVSTDLEVQKQSITQSPQPLASAQPQQIATPIPTPPAKQDLASPDTSSPTPTPVQIAQVSTTTPIRTQQAVAALQINQTQQNVSQTIADLQELVDKDDDDQKDNRRNDRREMNEKKVQDKMDKKDKRDKDTD